MREFVISLLQTSSMKKMKRLLRKLEATHNAAILKRFAHIQGISALKNALVIFGKTDLPLFYQVRSRIAFQEYF